MPSCKCVTVTELRSPADMSSLIHVLPNDDAHVIVFYYILIIFFLHLSLYNFLFFKYLYRAYFVVRPVSAHGCVGRPCTYGVRRRHAGVSVGAQYVQRSAVLVQITVLLSRLCDQVL